VVKEIVFPIGFSRPKYFFAADSDITIEFAVVSTFDLFPSMSSKLKMEKTVESE
jgi:hypothetical protein